MKSNKRSKNVKKRKIDCKRQKRQGKSVNRHGNCNNGAMEAASSQRIGLQFPPQALFLFSTCAFIFPTSFLFLFLSFFENIVCNCCFRCCCCCFQATIGSNGRPSNRTVVFRGFQENTDQIQINTDSRTHKVPFIFLIYTL